MNRYENEELTDKITAWAQEHCQTFITPGDATVEQPLRHTDLYNDYCSLFEDLIEEFLTRNHMSITEFYQALLSEQRLCERVSGRVGNINGLNTTFGSVLLSATDYFDFCQMMYDVNQGGEAVFCPPLVDCDDGEDMRERVSGRVEVEVKAEGKSCEEYKHDYSEDSKSQCK